MVKEGPIFLNMLKTTIIVFLLHSVSSRNENKPLVQTPLGDVRGSVKTSIKGQKFAAFEGIPYAKPPIGEKRFQAPEPITPWEGIWDAVYPTECLQRKIFQQNETMGDEDCLHINVYVPSLKPNPRQNLDVIVHIHGGAYIYGSGHEYSQPEILIAEDIIFVTFNYRLGIFGFLSAEDEILPGNNGLKDQVMALRWIQKYIRSFGGNPHSVTLTGLSAGGASVHLHYLSEMSQGLFHRGFSQSGVALNPWSLQKAASTKARMLAEAVGCPSSNTKLFVKCLKQRPHEHLLDKMGLFYGANLLPISPFGPVVEKGSNPFLKAHPYELLSTGKVLDVPWILSNTAHEGYIPEILPRKPTDDDEHWDEFAPIFLDFNYTIDKQFWPRTSKFIKEFYVADDNYIRMFGDRHFHVDAETALKLHAKAITSPVFHCILSYSADERIQFVGHGEDIKYFFGPLGMPMESPKVLTPNELKMRTILVELLISYAKIGTRPVINGVEWKPIHGDNITYLNINTFKRELIRLKAEENLYPVDFWRALGLQENQNLFVDEDEL